MKHRTALTDRTAEIRRATDAACRDALELIGARAAAYARALAPVRTGVLQRSVRHRVSGRRAAVYSDAAHAVLVELGGPRGQPARPFLSPAMLDHGAEYREILNDRLKQ